MAKKAAPKKAAPGNVDIQMAQNTADALMLTILRGGSMDVKVF